MHRRALKSTTMAVLALTITGATACSPPPRPPVPVIAPVIAANSGWIHPRVPSTCAAAAQAAGDLVGCVLGYATVASQHFGTPPFPVAPVAAATGLPAIPPVALDAYRKAVNKERKLDKACNVTVDVVAGIGYNESRHAVNGARLNAKGDISPPIIGPATSIPNKLSPTDKVRFQNFGPFIQAVGATQFLPATWKAYEPDGNGDGLSDPFNIYDDALGTTMYLCRVSHMTTAADILASVSSYGYRTPKLQSGLFGYILGYRIQLAGTKTIGTVPLSATTGVWKWNGGSYNGSPALAAWEATMVRTTTTIGPLKAGTIIGPPEVVPLFAGFLGDLVRGGYSIKEAYSYAFRCTSNSASRDCAGLDADSLSLHAYGLAMDVNWSTNPELIYRSTGTTSACALPVKTDFPAWVISAAQRWGLFWGGYGWSGRCSGPTTSSTYVNRDAMHFEFRGTPELAKRIVAWNASHPAPASAKPPA